MGFIPVTDLPCSLSNPISHLDPYLIDLDVSDALESFNQLADSVLANQPPCSPLSESSFSSDESSPSNSQWLSSNLNSPDTSEHTYSPSSSTSFSSSAFSSPSSSNPASVASSHDSDDEGRGERRGRRRRRRNSGRGDRKVKNASAAEKYRKRVKGRHSSLLQQMEKEQERNNILKRDLESKMTLYREFVALLAQNTTNQDLDLASLGSQSLSKILTNVFWPQCPVDEDIRLELETQLSTFQQIIQSNTQTVLIH